MNSARSSGAAESSRCRSSNWFGHTGENARLVPGGLGLGNCALAPDLEHLLHLPDLADEEPVAVKREQHQDKPVVLIARARQRSDVRTRSHMCAVPQRQRQSDLPPQLLLSG